MFCGTLVSEAIGKVDASGTLGAVAMCEQPGQAPDCHHAGYVGTVPAKAGRDLGQRGADRLCEIAVPQEAG